jgi:hypothetical protein
MTPLPPGPTDEEPMELAGPYDEPTAEVAPAEAPSAESASPDTPENPLLEKILPIANHFETLKIRFAAATTLEKIRTIPGIKPIQTEVIHTNCRRYEENILRINFGNLVDWIQADSRERIQKLLTPEINRSPLIEIEDILEGFKKVAQAMTDLSLEESEELSRALTKANDILIGGHPSRMDTIINQLSNIRFLPPNQAPETDAIPLTTRIKAASKSHPDPIPEDLSGRTPMDALHRRTTLITRTQRAIKVMQSAGIQNALEFLAQQTYEHGRAYRLSALLRNDRAIRMDHDDLDKIVKGLEKIDC